MDGPVFAVSTNGGLFTELSLSRRDENKTKATMLAPTLHRQPTTGPPIRWALLSIEESLSTLESTTELPTIEDFIDIVGKCRKQRNLEHAHRVHAHIHDKGLDAHKSLGNYLVPLFVECGSLFQAHQIFGRLNHQNEFSWTSLIQGYVEHGDFVYAFDLFDTMQDDCVLPSTCTFLALLRACAKMKWSERGRELNAKIDDLGYQCDPYIGNSLVGMYAKCGSFTEARESFDKLLVRDIVSWNALMTGYVEHGMDKEALLCAEQLHSEGLAPDAITFVCILKACGNLGAFETSYRVHIEILERGIDCDPIVGNALVDTYAGAGKFAEARSVLHSLPSRDVKSWCALITGYLEHGFGEEALNCVDQMQHEGVHPDGLTYVCSLKACGTVGAIFFGEILHLELIVEGFEGDLYVGNILVDMYAKCGRLLEAQEVFDELVLVRDTVSWNTLLAAYVEHDRGEEALEHLELMQSEGVSRDAATYVSSLKACSITGNLTKGQELLIETSAEGFDEDPLVVNILVNLFAKYGSFAEARDLFEELQPVKDAAAWNALISGYAENGAANEALDCVECMQQEGVCPDAITFVCGLKACGSMRAIDRLLHLHAEMVRYGFDKNTYIENTLVDGYAKCGFFTEARQMLEHLSYQETLSWSALMAGLLEHGLAEEVIICLEQMEGEGVSPNEVTYLCSLRACASLGAINKGQEVHANIVKLGYSSDSYVGNSAVDMYSKCGLFEDAHMVLTELTDRDVVSWTTLISGFAEYGLGDRVLEMMMDMWLEGIFPNAATYICCLGVCSAARAIDRGREFHLEAVKAGLDEDHLFTNSLIDMYCKCGTLEEANIVFNRLSKPDIISWTALFSGSIEHGFAQEALTYFDQMQQDGVSPTSATFLCGIKGCAGIGAIQKGHILHTWMVQLGLEEDASVGIALVDMYSKCGFFDEAYELLNLLPMVDAVPWTAVIAGYAERGHTKEALECFKEMQEVGIISDVVSWNAIISSVSQQCDGREALVLFAQMQDQGILPDCSTLLSILEASGDIASIEYGRRVHAQSAGPSESKPSDMIMCTALIDMYSKCGSLNDAKRVFDEASSRDCFNWTAILTTFARQGDSESVFACFKRMREEAIYPDDVTFLSVLSACRHSGLVERGHMFFEAMTNEYGILPTMRHHNVMVDLLCRVGQLSEAACLLKTIDDQPDSGGSLEERERERERGEEKRGAMDHAAEAQRTDLMTITRFVLNEQSKFPEARGDLTILLNHIVLGCKFVCSSVSKAGLAKLIGLAGVTNVQGEEQKKLDVLSNDVFIKALVSSGRTNVLVSEELEEAVFVEELHRGRYCVVFDPLDGSSNIDCGVSIGTIFGIYMLKEGSAGTLNDVLQPGKNMIAAGYCMYGSSCTLVLTTGTGVNGFTLDPSLGEFILTHPHIKVPQKGKIYSVNEGNAKNWDEPTRKFVEDCKFPKDGSSPKSLRYIGSMVADVHRTLLYGGIFLYPADKKSPNGKLRVLYEVFPMSFLVEQAGGQAFTGKGRALDIIPSNIHDRSPIFLGSYDDVEKIKALYASS